MSAVISSCGLYRYRLDRELDMLGGKPVGFCLHNPSTADAERDDPTSRRGVGFAKAWGCSRMVFVNAWAARATRPRDLWAISDPVGPDNDMFIAEVATEVSAAGGFMVAAWGVVHRPFAVARLRRVEGVIRDTGCMVCALGVNLDGSPKHPLYVRANSMPLAWPDSWRNS